MNGINVVVLIAPKTAGETSSFFTVGSSPTSIIATGLAGSEDVTVQIYDPATTAYANLLSAGSAVKLDKDANAVQIIGPATYRVVKSATTAAVGVSFCREA